MGLDFDGSTQRVVIGDVFDFGASDNFSLVASIKTSFSGVAQTIIHKSQSGEPYKSWGLDISGAGNIGSYIYDGANTANLPNVYVVTDGVLHNIVLSFDGASATGMNMYVDGVLKGTTNPTAIGDLTMVTNINIGYWGTGNSNYFNGIIQEVRVYRRALSAEEVKIIHYSNSGDNIVNSLIGKWLMNEKPDGSTATVASSVIDVSGLSNHATPTNSPIYRASPTRIIKPNAMM